MSIEKQLTDCPYYFSTCHDEQTAEKHLKKEHDQEGRVPYFMLWTPLSTFPPLQLIISTIGTQGIFKHSYYKILSDNTLIVGDKKLRLKDIENYCLGRYEGISPPRVTLSNGISTEWRSPSVTTRRLTPFFDSQHPPLASEEKRPSLAGESSGAIPTASGTKGQVKKSYHCVIL